MAWTVSGNLKGPKGDTGTTGTKGDTGTAGAGVSIAGTVATYATLPSGLGPSDNGKGYLVSADGKLYVWDGSAFPADGAGANFQGPAGVSASVAAGTATGLAAGASPTVTNSGSGTAAVFDFGIPAGAKGDTGNTGATGSAATVTAGSATPLAAGTSPTVSNSGTSSAAVFNFGIPAGATGAAGGKGDAGTRGSNWYTGSGAPGSISGSSAGDQYLDTTSGDVYTLA